MRGLKSDRTAETLLDGFVAYYKFCRKHQTIGMTPAQVAGLQPKGWKELIEKAQRKKTNDELLLLSTASGKKTLEEGVRNRKW